MKKLYLIRHAKSSWKDSDLSDFDRPLNKRGRKDAPKMGRRLKARGEMPDLLLSSSARRAVSTAAAISEEIGHPKNYVQYREDLYHASAQGLLDIIKQTKNSVDKLFLIGHNPGLNDFANMLSSQKIENIVTCGIYVLECPISKWKALNLDEQASVLYYDYPKREEDL